VRWRRRLADWAWCPAATRRSWSCCQMARPRSSATPSPHSRRRPVRRTRPDRPRQTPTRPVRQRAAGDQLGSPSSSGDRGRTGGPVAAGTSGRIRFEWVRLPHAGGRSDRREAVRGAGIGCGQPGRYRSTPVDTQPTDPCGHAETGGQPWQRPVLGAEPAVGQPGEVRTWRDPVDSAAGDFPEGRDSLAAYRRGSARAAVWPARLDHPDRSHRSDQPG